METGESISSIRALNNWYWEDLARFHSIKCADLTAAVVNGASTLRHLELNAVGDPRGRQLLHLMCHLGHDSVSWARLGARVVAADASKSALSAASKIADRSGVNIEFERILLPATPANWLSRFEFILMTYGTIAWVSELDTWAESCFACLSAGGHLVVIDDHPLADCLRPLSDGKSLTLDDKLFVHAAGGIRRHRTKGSYVDRTAKIATPVHYRWHHSISDLINALTRAGLKISKQREYPFTHYDRFPSFVLRSDGYFDPPKVPPCPLMFSVVAKKPA